MYQHRGSQIRRDKGINVLLSDWLQGDSAALHLFSGHQLLLDSGRRPLPPQPHLHGLPIRLQVPLGLHTNRMGWVKNKTKQQTRVSHILHNTYCMTWWRMTNISVVNNAPITSAKIPQSICPKLWTFIWSSLVGRISIWFWNLATEICLDSLSALGRNKLAFGFLRGIGWWMNEVRAPITSAKMRQKVLENTEFKLAV